MQEIFIGVRKDFVCERIRIRAGTSRTPLTSDPLFILP